MKSGFTIWLSGLSGSGKTTISKVLETYLEKRGRKTHLLDGDEIRKNLSSDLGFNRADRDKNVQRVGWICSILNKHGIDTVVALISPYRETRQTVLQTIPFAIEVFTNCPIEILEQRDPKGFYKKARLGELSNFTGVSDPYEAPLNPDITCLTDGSKTPEECGLEIIQVLEQRNWIA